MVLLWNRDLEAIDVEGYKIPRKVFEVIRLAMARDYEDYIRRLENENRRLQRTIFSPWNYYYGREVDPPAPVVETPQYKRIFKLE